MEQNEPRIEGEVTITYGGNKPMEAVATTIALSQIAALYNDFLRREGIPITAETKLYLSDIRKGSLIATLVAYSAQALPLFADMNTVATFVQNFRNTVEYFGGNRDTVPYFTNKRERNRLKDVLQPVVTQGGGGSLNIATGNNSSVNVYNITNLLAENATDRIEAEDAKQDTGVYTRTRVALKWHQARFVDGEHRGDKAIIPKISDQPVSVVAEAALKEEIQCAHSGFDAPWQSLIYYVDIEVTTLNGKPKAALITKWYPDMISSEE